MIRSGNRAARPLRGRALRMNRAGLWNPIETRKALLIGVANRRFTTRALAVQVVGFDVVEHGWSQNLAESCSQLGGYGTRGAAGQLPPNLRGRDVGQDGRGSPFAAHADPSEREQRSQCNHLVEA